jgi:cation diffusion facilitator CzcD-associated flavoprotein CzcO
LEVNGKMADKSIIIIGAGLSGSATGFLMGRNLVRQLCKKDRKEFVTTTAD